MIFACFFRLAPTGALLYSHPCFLGCKDLFYSPLLFRTRLQCILTPVKSFSFNKEAHFERKKNIRARAVTRNFTFYFIKQWALLFYSCVLLSLFRNMKDAFLKPYKINAPSRLSCGMPCGRPSPSSHLTVPL